MAELVILGAAYGPADVSATVRSLMKDNSLTVTANNATFGDTWKGTEKSLVVVYMYDTQKPGVLILKEGQTGTIAPPAQPVPWSPNPVGELTILGAAYGLGDVTTKVDGLVSDNALTVVANNATFGDTWKGTTKTMVVVYSYNDIPLIRIVKENETMVVQNPPPLQILGATYGPADVTATVSGQIDPFQEIHLTASNDLFGDTWKGTTKSLAVIYQYGDEQPQTAVVQENHDLNITYIKRNPFLGSTDPATLTILGAAYGLGDVTAKAASLVSQNQLSVTANNATFSDTWKGTVKTLTVVYRYGRGTSDVAVCKENEQLTIASTITVSADLVPLMGLLESGNVINLKAMNNFYVTCDDQRRLVATGQTPDQGCTISVVASGDGFVLQTDGKYVKVGSDQRLYATAGTVQEATVFTFSISTKGALHIASNGLYLALADENFITLSETDYTLLLTSFDIGIQQVEEAQNLKAMEISNCDTAWATFVWQLTGGFFLAIGLGPYVVSGRAQTGIMSLLQRNSLVWGAITGLVNGLKSNPTITAAAALGVVKIIYNEGLLWPVLKFALSTLGWWGVARALSKVIEIVFLPEVEAADLLASFAVWSVQTTQAGLNIHRVC